MADEIDIAQQYEHEERERYILNARSKQTSVSRLTCDCCSAPIPEARRIAVPGVELCVTCQTISESKNKHLRGKK
ncbi:TraR/DksA family transcriptional regulator [Kosakonia sp. YIM B13605]|uniref:TraR/DksA family transcriptional regulator n=1 Tax=Kosakonia TaxID=1330547 RepID=UPI0032D9A7F3